MTLRIGIDAWPLVAQPTGIGRYVRELCLRLAARMRDAEFFLYSPRTIDFPELPGWIRHAGTGTVLPGYVWLKWALPRACAGNRLDVFWATRTLAPRLSPRTAIVSTVYDLNYRIAPETMQAANRWAHRLWFARDVARAAAVVSISQGTSDRLAGLLGRPADAVAHPAVGPHYRRPPEAPLAAVLARHGIAKPYLLAVGTREPRKNLDRLVAAHAALHARGAIAHTLVLAGAAGWGGGARSAAPVQPLGYVDEADLPALYAGADLFVLPSLYEGFGMPALEARACGTRVVASDVPEIREAGGAAARYVAPTVDGLAEGIVAALHDPPPAPDVALPSWDASAAVLERLLRAAARRG